MHFPDFFLGAIVLGFMLCNYDASRLGGKEAVGEMINLMHSALAVTKGLCGSFREATRFYTAIGIILRKMEGPQISSIEFDFQDFTGTTIPVPDLTPGTAVTNDTDPGLQEFQTYFDSAEGFNWVCTERVLGEDSSLITPF